MLIADYSAAKLTGAALAAAGFGGVIRYAGTPGRTKNTNGAEVASLHAAGLQVHGVYENSTTDFTGGYAAGVANANALLADANACGVDGALFMSADQHLTPAQVAVWSAYLQGAQTVLGRRMGAYGFKEALLAAQAIGVRNLWQCGSRSDLLPGANVYQRNTGGTTVAGTAVDINDLITPITVSDPGGDMPNISRGFDVVDNAKGHAYLTLSCGQNSAYFSGGWIRLVAVYGSTQNGIAEADINFIEDNGTAHTEKISVPWNKPVPVQIPASATVGIGLITVDWTPPADGTLLDVGVELASR